MIRHFPPLSFDFRKWNPLAFFPDRIELQNSQVFLLKASLFVALNSIKKHGTGRPFDLYHTFLVVMNEMIVDVIFIVEPAILSPE